MNTLQAKKQKKIIDRITESLFLLFIFLLPLQTRYILIQGELQKEPWEYGTVSLYGVDIVYICFLFFALASITIGHPKKKTHPATLSLISITLLLLAFFSGMHGVNSTNTAFWLVKLAQGISLFLIIPHLHIHRYRIALAFITSGTIQAALAMVQFVMQSVLASKWLGMAAQIPVTLGTQVIEINGIRFLRSYGSFPHPNILGGFLVVSILLTVIVFFRSTEYTRRIPYAVLLTIQSVGLWCTFSRQAWIALLVSLVFIIIYILFTESHFPKKAVLGILYILLPLIIFSSLFPDFIITRTQGTQRLEQHSISQRQLNVEEGAAVIAQEWVFGTGIGNYTAYLERQDSLENIAQPAFAYQPIHNLYLLVWAELGVFGLLLFIYIIVYIILEQKKSKDILWITPFLALVIIGLFDHYLWSLHSGIVLFWMVAALAVTNTPNLYSKTVDIT